MYKIVKIWYSHQQQYAVYRKRRWFFGWKLIDIEPDVRMAEFRIEQHKAADAKRAECPETIGYY